MNPDWHVEYDTHNERTLNDALQEAKELANQEHPVLGKTITMHLDRLIELIKDYKEKFSNLT